VVLLSSKKRESAYAQSAVAMVVVQKKGTAHGGAVLAIFRQDGTAC
jgi:hypothetical protein